MTRVARRGRGVLAALVPLFALLAVVQCAGRAGDPQTRPPNVLVILADDLGFNDLGAYGNRDVETPNIDRLAAEGYRFDRFYSLGDVCAPTRASLISGLYPQRLGYRHGLPWGLSEDVVTLPELLQGAGYATAYVGKWHLGHVLQQARPLAQGYQSFFGFLLPSFLSAPGSNGAGAPTYLDPLLVVDDGEPAPYSGHLTDLLTDHAVRLIRDGDRGQPWFITIAYLAPHLPVQPPDRWADRYPATPKGRYDALVSTLDEDVGRVLDALEDAGAGDTTVVVFLSDNGPAQASADFGAPFMGAKGEFFEGSLRVPLIVRLPDRRGGVVIDGVATSNDIYPTIAALTGTALEHAVDGRDLAPLFDGVPRLVPGRPTFWEALEYVPPWATDSPAFQPAPARLAPGLDFSVLSADARWRLTKENGGLALFDLEADPSGDTDVAAEYPELVAQLVASYEEWARDTRRIATRVVPRNGARWDGAVARLSGASDRIDILGSDLLRTPGEQGWSFAVGIRPDNGAQHPRVIAQQEGVWSMTDGGDGGLRVELGDARLSTEAPAAGTCAAVVVTAMFHLERRELALYIDGRPAGSRAVEAFEPGSFSAPTWLGNDGGSERGFSGTLDHPTFFNARLDEQQVAEISSTLCGT